MPISKYAFSVSVSDSGRVVAVVDISKVSHMQVYSSQGDLEENWAPPKGINFEFCRIRQDYVLATYGDVVSLFGSGGKEQLWTKSFQDLWPDAVTMSIDSKRIVVASYPVDAKSTVWILDIDGNRLWNRQVESKVWDTAITPEGFVVASGEKYGVFADKGRNAVYLFRPNGSLAWWKETDSPVISVAVSDDCTHIVAGLDNGGMLLLDRNGHVMWEKEAIGAWVDISGDGQSIVASSLENLVVLDIDGDIIWQSDAIGYFPDHLNISRNGKTIVGLEMPAVYEGNRVCVFNKTGEKAYCDTDSNSSPRVAVSENGQFVAIAFGRELRLLRCGEQASEISPESKKVETGEDESKSDPLGGSTGETVEAWVAAQQFVKEKLISPSTAKFNGVACEPYVVYLGDARYQVRASVASENVFGAVIRTEFVVIVRANRDKHKTWTLESLSIF